MRTNARSLSCSPEPGADLCSTAAARHRTVPRLCRIRLPWEHRKHPPDPLDRNHASQAIAVFLLRYKKQLSFQISTFNLAQISLAIALNHFAVSGC